jgi:hypothetical protein
MELTDSLEQVTRIELSDVEHNPALADECSRSCRHPARMS